MGLSDKAIIIGIAGLALFILVLLAPAAADDFGQPAALLQSPGLRPLKHPAVVVPIFYRYRNRNLTLPLYRSSAGDPASGWARKFVVTRRFASDQSAWIYYRCSDLAHSRLVRVAGARASMRLWPIGTLLILEGYPQDARLNSGRKPVEIALMQKTAGPTGGLAADAYYAGNWSYAGFSSEGRPILTAEEVNACHSCHRIAFQITGDLVFTRFP